MMIDFTSPCGSYKLTFDDNGKVAYAYLKEISSREIVGEVWLYNRCETQSDSEFQDKSNIPFANPKNYISEQGRLQKSITLKDVLVDWEYEERTPVAYIYVEEDLYGVVGVGDKPGYARHALKNNRLARILEFDD